MGRTLKGFQRPLSSLLGRPCKPRNGNTRPGYSIASSATPSAPPPLDPTVLAWNGGTVPQLAQAIYHDRRFGDLPILADALDEAGCSDPSILSHCRSGSEHVRGCWVVDL